MEIHLFRGVIQRTPRPVHQSATPRESPQVNDSHGHPQSSAWNWDGARCGRGDAAIVADEGAEAIASLHNPLG